MKIEEYTAQATVLPQALPAKTEQSANAAQTDAAAKQPKSKDKVQLSGMSPISVDTREQDVARAQRVEAIKASVSAGKYQVPARAVAESMISKIAGSGTRH
ncbi:flagellar biosynthesis anti-sigma factor FlgM [Geomesophilobacter sediminis]|uniref:Negative regulator of flagellin synthesis n=1 Tax=Geomesophilobacter sediminis TaxID=2798584 RepID=A0A8J7S8R2_9BACT|nr:flagellar biosynthesis anti-sigma factor FlgM [Geomesophilobacter sediminis]MBJ6727747.1 flagellar biosynthesis anti-sigma factor FlgM [Geomesophilobacter sediminis]